MLGRGDRAAEGPPSPWALCVQLPWRAGSVRASLALVVLVAAAGVAAAVGGRDRPWGDAVPAIAAAALAWGSGVMVAFAAGMRAIQRDRDEGITALLRARGIGPTSYTLARSAGIVVLLAVALGGAVVAVGACTAVASGAPARASRHALGALAYALAFAATVGPLALATLGGRSRAVGYVTLLAALAAPEALAPWTTPLLPPGSRELTSIPAALDALRHAVSGAGPAAPALRASLGLALVILASLWAVRARVGRVEGLETGEAAR